MLCRAIVELEVDLDQKEFEEWLVFLLNRMAHDPAYKAKVIHIVPEATVTILEDLFRYL